MLITIQEYADLVGMNKKSVEYHLREGNINYVEKYGKRLIDSRAKYPVSNVGRPPKQGRAKKG